MHGDGAQPPIPLKMTTNIEMQFAEVVYHEFTLEANLQLVDHVYVACQNDEVVYIYDHNHNVVATLENIQRVICMAPGKAFVHNKIRECIHTIFNRIASIHREISIQDALALLHKPIQLLHIDFTSNSPFNNAVLTSICCISKSSPMPMQI